MENVDLMGCIRPAGKPRECPICGRTDIHGHRAGDQAAYEILREYISEEPHIIIDEVVTEGDIRRARLAALTSSARGSSKTLMVGGMIRDELNALRLADAITEECGVTKVLEFKTDHHTDQLSYAVRDLCLNIHRERLAAWGDSPGKRIVNEARKQKDRRAAKLAKAARKRNR